MLHLAILVNGLLKVALLLLYHNAEFQRLLLLSSTDIMRAVLSKVSRYTVMGWTDTPTFS